MFHLTPRAILGVCLAMMTLDCGSSTAADPIVWRTEYAAARKEAEQKNLPLLIVVGTEQCFYCRKLETTTFADPEVVPFVAGGFVSLKIDANKDPEFARAMRVTLYPTTMIAGPDGKIFAYLAGYQSSEQFQSNSKKALALIPPPAKPLDTQATLTAQTRPETKVDILAGAVKATGPADPMTRPQPQVPTTAKDLLSGVKLAFREEKFADCLDRADVLMSAYPGSSEADDAAGVVAAVHADAERLAIASDQSDERFAGRYYAIGESLAAKGRGKEAIQAFEKVQRLTPNGRWADLARSKLPGLYKQFPTIKAER
jgi:thioredoxin-like negative regulator of GroEL